MSPLLLLTVLSAQAPAVGPPVAGPAALVRQLGSEKYAIRSDAERRLLALGERAVPAVEAGRRDADLEVRRRCQALLANLRAAVCAGRVKALRAGRADHRMPLWDHYRRMIGPGREAMALFAEIYEKECEVFEDIALALRRRDHKEASRLHQEQVERFVGKPIDAFTRERMMRARVKEKEPPPDLPQRVRAALFLGALPGVDLDDHGWGGLTGPLSYNVALRRELAAKGPRGQLARGLLGRWCLAARSEYAVWNALWQVMIHPPGETGRQLARRSLAHDSLQVHAGVACVLGRHGQEEDIRRLLPLLKVKENYHQVLWGIEVGDVALEALVRLTGQKVGDYGVARHEPLFTMRRVLVDGNERLDVLVPCYPVAIYREPAQREAAFRRWREWAKKHPKRLGLAEGQPGPQPYSPRRAYEEARTAALEQYVGGYRLLHWGRSRSGEGRGSALVRLTIEADRLKVDPPADIGRPRPSAGRSGVVPVFGRAAVIYHEPDDLGRISLQLKSAFSDDRAGVLAKTSINRNFSTVVVEIEHREPRETLLVRYEQPGADEVTLTVRRTRNADGKALSAKQHTAKDLAALKTAAPDDHALLMSLLKQRGAKVAGK